MNENVYTHIDGEIVRSSEWNTTPPPHLGRDQGATAVTAMNEDNLIKIRHEDPITRTHTTLKIYNHQIGSLSKSHSGDNEKTDRLALLQDMAELIISAHKDHNHPIDDPALKYSHLAADTPTTLLTWLKKHTRTTCQHLTIPLFMTPEIFTEPPTLMPSSRTVEQKLKWKMKEQQIPQGTGLDPNWSDIPWLRNGILALTAGTANSIPDPSSHTLATEAIKKAALSAHYGISTILLLEAQQKLELTQGQEREIRIYEE